MNETETNELFATRCYRLWREMERRVLALAERKGERYVNDVVYILMDTLAIEVRDGRVFFMGTMDEIASAVDKLTATIEAMEAME